MKVVLFGATGIVGRAILKEALKQGFDVVALTRDKNKITIGSLRGESDHG